MHVLPLEITFPIKISWIFPIREGFTDRLVNFITSVDCRNHPSPTSKLAEK
ncbi:hypothetical protein J6590_064438 [Homalodisca vitripennis]|nr:hypothetical protein J6590_064438 [Homalodisca vitripennis]